MTKRTAQKRNTTKRNARLEKAIANVWGRPRKYDDAEQFDYDCRVYLATLKWDAPTIEGICNHLGISRDTWNRYEKQPAFKEVVARVRQFIKKWWLNTMSKQGRAVGCMFYIKNLQPDEYKDRGAGSSPDEPLHIKEITGMIIKRG